LTAVTKTTPYFDTHVCNSNCNALTDGDNSNISSAYKIIQMGTKPMVHPTFCSSTPVIMSLMYKANRYGDKTPPCLIPRSKQYVSENMEHHRTHVIQVLNQFSITHSKLKGTFLCISLKTNHDGSFCQKLLKCQLHYLSRCLVIYSCQTCFNQSIYLHSNQNLHNKARTSRTTRPH